MKLAAHEAADLERKMAVIRERCNVPPRYQHASRLGIDRVPVIHRNDYRECLENLWTLKDQSGLIALLGSRGVGKSYMACALVNQFCSEGRYAVYAEAMDYFIAIQESYDDGAKVAASKIEARYLKPELLILDAMEERADTAWNDRMLVRLINKRYAAELSTVLISNEMEKDFNARVGSSIVDRIKDDGGKIVCKWESLRGKIGVAA